MKPEDPLGSNEGKWRINWERDRKCCAFRTWRVVGPGGAGGGGDGGGNVGEYERESSQLKDKRVIRMRRCESGNT